MSKNLIYIFLKSYNEYFPFSGNHENKIVSIDSSVRNLKRNDNSQRFL